MINKRHFLCFLGVLFFFLSCKKEDKAIPILTTNEIKDISQTTISCGGKISSDGGSEIIERGICLSLKPNPSISDSVIIVDEKTNDFEVIVNNLMPNTSYYLKAFAKNINGIGYGNEQNIKTLSFSIGDKFGGGVVFYIFPSGQHGLIASQFDANIGTDWGCFGTAIPNAQNEGIGFGKANSKAILQNCATPNIAARICDNYTLGGFEDWYLPSKDELNAMYNAKDLVGGFSDYYYWSSTESRTYYAWIQAFLGGTQGTQVKSSQYRVRAIRDF
ncbi:MAG: DUF1566 domain-containing protein [Bacteroidetes bacterium]|nr:DUF1566 domain-containing protein [Bacteroidota bacterium]